MKKHRILICFLFLFINSSSVYSQKLFQEFPLSVGKYSESIKVHLNEVKRLDDTFGWIDEADRYVYLEGLLAAAQPMNDVVTAEAIMELLYGHEKIFPSREDKYYKFASEVLAESYKLSGIYEPISVIETIIPYFEQLDTNYYMASDSIKLSHYGRLIDAYMNVDDFDTAEILLYTAYSKFMGSRNLYVEDIYALHVRAIEIMISQRKTIELKELGEQLLKLDNEGMIYQLPTVFNMTARLAYALTAIGEFGYATNLLRLFHEYKHLSIRDIPNQALINFTLAESFIRAFNGKFPEENTFNFIENNAEKEALNELFLIFASLNNREQINFDIANGINEELLNKVILANYNKLMTKFSLAALLDLYAVRYDEKQYFKTLTILSNLIQKEYAQETYLDFDKKQNFLDSQILNSIFRSARVIYGGEVPEKFANLILPISLPAYTEVDMYARSDNVKNNGKYDLKKQFRNNVKLSREFSANLMGIANQITKNAIETSQNQSGTYEKNDDTYLGAAFSNELQEYVKRAAFLENYNFTKNTNIGDDFPSLEKLSLALTDKQSLFTIASSSDYLFVCKIEKYSSKCRIQKIPENFFELISQLRKQILSINLEDEFDSNLSENIYSFLFDGFNLKTGSNLLFHTDFNLVSLPFNVLKNDKNDFLGKEFAISLVPSLLGRKSLKNKNIEDLIYLGIGNPEYAPRKALASNLTLFTTRSAALVNSLAKLTPLPETKKEILEASKFFENSDVLLGQEASEFRFRLSNVSQADVIHFATHGLISGEIENNRISLPSLALSFNQNPDSELEDGLLNSLEIAEMNLRAKTVILSACRTMSDEGEYNPGFGGLTSSFLNAGANSVIATQWKVDSLSATEFIIDFVKNITEDGHSSEEALKYSNRELSKLDEKFTHPYFWAPFVNITFLNIAEEINSINLKQLYSEKISGGNSEYLTSWKSSGNRFFLGYEQLFEINKAKSFISWFEKGEQKKLYLDGGNASLVRSDEKFTIIFISPHQGSYFGGAEFIYFDNVQKKISRIKRIEELNHKISVLSNFVESQDGYFALGTKFDFENEFRDADYLIKFSKSLDLQYSIEIPEAVSPRLVVLNENIFVSDIGKMFESEIGEWSIYWGGYIPTIRESYFSIKQFDESNKEFLFIGDFKGTLSSMSSKIDNELNIISWDRNTFDVLKFDEQTLTMQPIFKWPHQVLRVMSKSLDNQRYWFVQTMEKISIAKTIGFADTGFEERMKNISNGGFTKNKLIAEDYAHSSTIFKLSPQQKLLYSSTSRLTGFINVFEPTEEGIFLAGVKDRDESFMSILSF